MGVYGTPDLGLIGNHPISQICDLLVFRSLKSAISWSPPGPSNLQSLPKSPGLRDRLRGTKGRCYPFNVDRPCCSPVFGVSLTAPRVNVTLLTYTDLAVLRSLEYL